ncbi:MAG: LapA family protein [Syntrophales bacterium]|nr:LapA family protein [Syntrophales bacterium]
MKLLYTIVIMLVVLFVITFSMDNTEMVHLSYYGFIDHSVPAYLLLFISFGAGIIFAGFFGTVERWRLARKISGLNRKIRRLEDQAARAEEGLGDTDQG